MNWKQNSGGDRGAIEPATRLFPGDRHFRSWSIPVSPQSALMTLEKSRQTVYFSPPCQMYLYDAKTVH